MEQRRHNKDDKTFKWIFYLCIALLPAGPDGSLQCLGHSAHNNGENSFLPWSEQSHFTQHVRASQPPMASSCLLMVEQQVNTAHMEKDCCQSINN